MKILRKRITFEDPTKPMKLFALGDFHVGSSNCVIDELEAQVEKIKTTVNGYAILMGDVAECIELKDKRFDIASIDKRFHTRLGDLSVAQYEYLIKLLTPIKEKIICAVRGNHDETIRLKYFHDVHLDLCRNLGIEDASSTAFVVLSFDRSQFHAPEVTLFLTHGWFAGRRTGSKMNNLESLSSSFEADIFLAGHSHDTLVNSKNILSVAGKNIKTRTLWYANTGTYLKTYSVDGECYGEKSCYPPAKIGCVTFTLQPSGKGVEIRSEI